MKKGWVRKRHTIVTKVLRVFFGPFTAWKYGIKVEEFKESADRQFLVLFNHQTAYDQFFIGMAFRSAVYYLASEDLFSIGFASKIIKFLVAPIPIKKQTTDLRAIKTCLEVAKEGGTIVISPEGQRTYSGETTYINPAISSMAKKLGLPIAFFKLDGGYGIQPRWSNAVRKGSMTAKVTRVLEPEEYKDLPREEFEEIIRSELYNNEARDTAEFKHKKLAEYLERAIYYCPDCGLSNFESHDDIITCKKCGMKIKYLPNQRLEGVGFDFPYTYVLDWYRAQEKYLNSIDTTTMTNEPIYTDTSDFNEVIVYKRKKNIWKDATVSLYGDRIEISKDGKVELFDFATIKAVTVVGNNKANLYRDKDIYQLKGDCRLNALKYVHFYHRYKNISEGNADVEFLGL